MAISTNREHPLTSEYHVSSRHSSDDSPLLVFVPGNPGLIDYYKTYLDLISEQYPEYDILAVSHAGFQTSGDYIVDGNNGDFVFYGLEYQIAHKCNIIKRRILAGHRKVSFLCHSVGGYITQRIISTLLLDEELCEVFEIEFVGLICPTVVDICRSESGVLFTKLFTYLPIIQIALGFLTVLQWVLSEALARCIIAKFIVARPVSKSAKQNAKLIEAWENAVDATFKIYRSKQIAWQALTLARQELQVIHRDDKMNDWFFHELPQAQNISIWCFFAESDHWVHDNTRDYILARYHDQDNQQVQFQIGEPTTGHSKAITHSFCIHQSEEFAEITCEALRKGGLGNRSFLRKASVGV